MYVEERKRGEIAVPLGDLPDRRDVDPVGGEIVVREHCALRYARGAGRINNERRIVAVERYVGTLAASSLCTGV
jgi:hypothetical protein